MLFDLLSYLFIISNLLLLVSAHGYVHQVFIDGKAYVGPPPDGGSHNPSVTREINDPGPVKKASNPFLNCGNDAQAAKLVAPANPGSKLSFDWKGADLSNWPHNTGPIITYMTNCGDTSCDQFDPSNAKWFKIAQVGRQKAGGDWWQQLVMNGQTANVTLPSTLAPGNYIIRHEIIALHLAVSEGGAEFYPSCTQLKVGGSQTGKPNDNEMVTFPGGYSDDDPGIFDPNVYDVNAPYTFPGPAVAKFVGASASSTDGSAPPNTGSSGNDNSGKGSPSSPSSPQGTSALKICRLRRDPALVGRNNVPETLLEPSQRRSTTPIKRGVKWHLQNAWKGIMLGRRS